MPSLTLRNNDTQYVCMRGAGRERRKKRAAVIKDERAATGEVQKAAARK